MTEYCGNENIPYPFSITVGCNTYKIICIQLFVYPCLSLHQPAMGSLLRKCVFFLSKENVGMSMC